MAGIAGIDQPGKSWLVNTMLDKMHHRGSFGRKVVETGEWTMGVAWPELQAEAGAYLECNHLAMDETDNAQFAVVSDSFILKRDPWASLLYLMGMQPTDRFALLPRSRLPGTAGRAPLVYLFGRPTWRS